MWNLRETTSVKPWWNLPRNLVTEQDQDGSVPENQRESKSNSAPNLYYGCRPQSYCCWGKSTKTAKECHQNHADQQLDEASPFFPRCIRLQSRSTDDSKDGAKTIVVAVATATATTWMPSKMTQRRRKKNYDVVSLKAWVRRVNCGSFIRSIANGFLLPKHHHLDLRMACQDTPGSNS